MPASPLHALSHRYDAAPSFAFAFAFALISFSSPPLLVDERLPPTDTVDLGSSDHRPLGGLVREQVPLEHDPGAHLCLQYRPVRQDTARFLLVFTTQCTNESNVGTTAKLLVYLAFFISRYFPWI